MSLPAKGLWSAVPSPSLPSQTSGGLYALGLVHANHGAPVVGAMTDYLTSASTEVRVCELATSCIAMRHGMYHALPYAFPWRTLSCVDSLALGVGHSAWSSPWLGASCHGLPERGCPDGAQEHPGHGQVRAQLVMLACDMAARVLTGNCALVACTSLCCVFAEVSCRLCFTVLHCAAFSRRSPAAFVSLCCVFAEVSCRLCFTVLHVQCGGRRGSRHGHGPEHVRHWQRRRL